MSYPLEITRLSMQHANGQKAYHLYKLVGSEQGVFVARWGKVGVFGDLKVVIGSSAEIHAAYDAKLAEKKERAYRVSTSEQKKSVCSWAELVQFVSPALIAKIGPEAVKVLDPAIDASRMAPLRPPRLDEDGRLTGLDKPRGIPAEEMRKLIAQQHAEEMNIVYFNDPDFARF